MKKKVLISTKDFIQTTTPPHHTHGIQAKTIINKRFYNKNPTWVNQKKEKRGERELTFHWCIIVSYPNFVQGLSFAKILILARLIALLGTNFRAIQKVFRCFGKECGKYPKGRAKGSLGSFFWPLACLGHQITSWWINQLAWRARLLQDEVTARLGELSSPGRAIMTPDALFCYK